jgi:hypothetical protein
MLSSMHGTEKGRHRLAVHIHGSGSCALYRCNGVPASARLTQGPWQPAREVLNPWRRVRYARLVCEHVRTSEGACARNLSDATSYE